MILFENTKIKNEVQGFFCGQKFEKCFFVQYIFVYSLVKPPPKNHLKIGIKRPVFSYFESRCGYSPQMLDSQCVSVVFQKGYCNMCIFNTSHAFLSTSVFVMETEPIILLEYFDKEYLVHTPFPNLE